MARRLSHGEMAYWLAKPIPAGLFGIGDEHDFGVLARSIWADEAEDDAPLAKVVPLHSEAEGGDDL